MYRQKFKPDGCIDWFKAWLVAKGLHQQEGIDFHKTFSPVIKVTTIHLLLSIAININWFIHQLDVSNVFLHGDLAELINIEQPPGFKYSQFLDQVCQLRKSLHCIKQAPREWFYKLKSYLLHFGFTGSKIHTSLSLKQPWKSMFLYIWMISWFSVLT